MSEMVIEPEVEETPIFEEILAELGYDPSLSEHKSHTEWLAHWNQSTWLMRVGAYLDEVQL